MANKKEKTCRKCGHKYAGRHCMNKSCVNYVNGKAKAKAAARRRSGSKGKSMHFGQLSAPIAPVSSPVSGQGGGLPVYPDAVPAPVTQHDGAISRANESFDYFVWLCAEDSAGLEAMRNEQDYFRYGF